LEISAAPSLRRLESREMGMRVYVVPSCAFLAILLGGWVRVCELLFAKLRRIWFVGGGGGGGGGANSTVAGRPSS